MKIPALRARIDRIDAQLVRLLNLRTRVALEIGAIKRRESLDAYAPAREQEVFNRVAAMNKGPLRPSSLRAIYREIMSAALCLEKPLKVAYTGQASRLSLHAALSRFGASVQYVPCRTLRGAFEAVEAARADYAIVPVGTAGRGEASALAGLARTRLTVCSEILLDADTGAGRQSHRFLVLGGNGSQPTGDDRTSLLVSGRGTGRLRGLAAQLGRRGPRVTVRVTEGARGRPGSRHVLVDIDGHVRDERVLIAVSALARHCGRVKILGSYPRFKEV